MTRAAIAAALLLLCACAPTALPDNAFAPTRFTEALRHANKHRHHPFCYWPHRVDARRCYRILEGGR